MVVVEKVNSSLPLSLLPSSPSLEGNCSRFVGGETAEGERERESPLH